MSSRPGSQLARRALHFFIVADCSGSMDSDGKMQALNNALRETLPHLTDIANSNPHAQVLIRAIAFSTGASWHVEEPTPVEQFRWTDLRAHGYTELGAALELLTSAFAPRAMEERALPPAVVLISDGMPTDNWETPLENLLAQPFGKRSVRMAVGIGRDADFDVLNRFVGPGDVRPVSAHNPEQLVQMIRWASFHASKVASEVPDSSVHGVTPVNPDEDEVVW